MTDMSKPGAHLESLLETLRFKQIDHYRQSKEHALKGDMYQEFAAELRHAIDNDALAAASPSEEYDPPLPRAGFIVTDGRTVEFNEVTTVNRKCEQ